MIAHMFSVGLLALLLMLPGVSQADKGGGGHPHFTFCAVTLTDDALLASGQVAGLGNQVKNGIELVVAVTADVECQDATTDPPTVLGSTTAFGFAVFDPKNGERTYQFDLDPFFLPCDPPAEIVVVSATTVDLTHDLECTSP